ncbi:MAG: hypothetical protein J4469_02080 [Candidatus Aenigmarchaeota archaeon]|nr:hypothetical protein [Candidatus Aenigmarchaeota archaeon]
MVEISAFLGPEFYGFILPFLFTFAIVYGLLIKANLFGKNERVAPMLALVIAFFVTAVGGPTLAAFFTNLFGGASMFLGGILVVILLVTLVSGKSQTMNLAVIVITVLIGAFLFLSSSSATGFIGIAVDSTTATLAFALVVILIAIYYITRPEGATAKKD